MDQVGAVEVIARYRDVTKSLRARLLRTIRRAGLTPWPRVFHSGNVGRERLTPAEDCTLTTPRTRRRAWQSLRYAPWFRRGRDPSSTIASTGATSYKAPNGSPHFEAVVQHYSDDDEQIDAPPPPPPDPDIERAFNWLLSFLPAGEWDRRKRAVEEHLVRVHTPARSLADVRAESKILANDRIAWYLWLAEQDIKAPWQFDPLQSTRILPTLHRFGADLDSLVQVRGIEDQVRHLLTATTEPDSALFEMLIALLWKRNGFKDVAFIPRKKKQKTPDVMADEWTVETKRMAAQSEYSIREHEKWYAMWQPMRTIFASERYPYILTIAFHVELSSLSPDFMVRELENKLRLVQFPCELVSNDTWTVRVDFVDEGRIARHFARNYVKDTSRQMVELVGGRWERGERFTGVYEVDFVRIGPGRANNRYIKGVSYADGAYWRCDAEMAQAKKARDVKGQLDTAIGQLPNTGKCAVHVGLDTLDGVGVERSRFRKIINSMAEFDRQGKDLHWVYCHLYESYSPPDRPDYTDETVASFDLSRGTICDPLRFHPAVIDPGEGAAEGVHWERPAP